MAFVLGLWGALFGGGACKERPAEAGDPPVGFTWLGVTPERKLHFRLTINTDKRIDQVDLILRYKTADGWDSPERDPRGILPIGRDPQRTVLLPWIPKDAKGQHEVPKRGQVYDVLLPLDQTTISSRSLKEPILDAEVRLAGVVFHTRDEWKRSF